MNKYCTDTINDINILLTTDKIQFSYPIVEEDAKILISKCKPASFGKGKESVLDDTYRRALTLKSNEFYTNFNVYEHISMINKINNLFACNNYIILEKLNVYQKDGFFKKHQDTPKSKLLGTLVICLPSEFTGGEFVIDNTTISFEPNQLKWIAFYSETLHEVLPVTSGNRFTLTYGIYKMDNIVDTNISKKIYDLVHSDKISKKLGYGCQNLSVSKKLAKGDDLKLYNWLETNNYNPSIETILNKKDYLEKLEWKAEESWLDCDCYCKETQKSNTYDEGIFHNCVCDCDCDKCSCLCDYKCENCICICERCCKRRDEKYIDIKCNCACNVEWHIVSNGSYENEGSCDNENVVSFDDIVESLTYMRFNIINQSQIEKIHVNIETDCYGNDPYSDDSLYQQYYIVFDNPNLN